MINRVEISAGEKSFNDELVRLITKQWDGLSEEEKLRRVARCEEELAKWRAGGQHANHYDGKVNLD